MVPDLMAGDFRTNEAGRAETADFLSQLFGRDPARARSLRAKARARMAADEKGLLDRLILQARLFEEGDPDDDEPNDGDGGDDGDEQPPEEEPPQEPEKPPYDPDHPRPGDPDDPEPEEPDEPKPPKPDKEKCQRLKVKLANAEQAAKEAQERARKEDAKFERWQEEAERLSELLKNKLIQLGLETAIPLIGNLKVLRNVLRGRIGNASTAAEIADLREKLDEANRKTNEALQARKVEEAEAAARQEEIERLREEISAAGCA